MIDEIKKTKVTRLIEENIPFPQLLKTLRHINQKPRRVVEEETLISSNRLQYLECGRFETMPTIDELGTLSFYFDLPLCFIKKKAREFIENKRHNL